MVSLRGCSGMETSVAALLYKQHHRDPHHKYKSVLEFILHGGNFLDTGKSKRMTAKLY